MRILFVGLGSIGQRHLQNLKEIDNSHELFALRVSKKDNVIRNGESIAVECIDDYYGIKSIYNLREALKILPEIVFITNPSSKHIQTALSFAKIGSHLFIEKPLGIELKDLNKLRKIVDLKNLITIVAYQQRFNPLIEKVKRILNENKLVSASFEWNTYLPAHHKYENYQTGYAAKKDLGGGVILCLIHEVDLIFNLFGLPDQLMCIGGHLSDLEIDVEDTIMSILEYGKSLISLNLSFAQTKEVRKFKIQLTDKTLFVDLTRNTFELYDLNGDLIDKSIELTTRDEMFKEELLYFLGCIKRKEKTKFDINLGRESLELALMIKTSMLSRKSIKI